MKLLRTILLVPALLGLPTAAVAETRPLLTCSHTDTDGKLTLNLAETSEERAFAELWHGNILGDEPRRLSELSRCTRSAAQPDFVQACNNIEWDDRWNVEFVNGISADGTGGTVAILSHNEVEEVTLQCATAEPDVAAPTFWRCSSEENGDLTIEFTEAVDGAISELNFFDDDDWTRLACGPRLIGAADVSGALCSFEDAGRYQNAIVRHLGRSLRKAVTLLEVDRFYNETVKTEFVCDLNADR
jgi:hypothetical protein